MKKIKLFALAAFAMLSTNVFAQGTSADGYLRYTYDASDNATITGFVASNDVATVSIPETVTDGTDNTKTYKVVGIGAEAFLDKTIITSVTIADENVATIDARAFKGCTNLTTVTIGKKVAAINGSAFEGCSKLATVTFNAAAGAQTIADNAFKGTAITNLDLTNTKVAAINKLFGSSNSTLTTVTIPASMTSIVADAFAGCSKLATVNFVAAGAAQTINAGAFAGTAIKTIDLSNTKIASLDRLFTELDGADVVPNITLQSVILPASLTAISAKAFHSCAKLSSVDLSACEALETINNFAFGTTPSLTALDFSACAALTIADTATPFIPEAGVKNNYLTEITLPEELASIGVALANLPNLATVNISETSITKLIAGALANDALITVLELPEECVTIASGALNDSKVQTLTINGDIAANGIDAVANTVAPLTSLTTVVFNGDIAATGIKANAFAKATMLGSVTFNGILAANAIQSQAFKGAGSAAKATAGIKLTVTYQPEGDEAAAFAQDAFSDDATDADHPVYVKLITTVAMKTALTANLPLNQVNLIESDAVSQDFDLEVAAPEGSSFFYGKIYEGGNYKVAKKQGDATVILYGAYVDASDAKIYMEQLHIIGGYYYVPANSPVVVKSTSSEKVKVEKDDAATENSMNYDLDPGTGVYVGVNQIIALDAVTVGSTLIDAPANATFNLYAMAKPEKYGLQWKTFKATTTLPASTFYVKVPKAKDAGRLQVVWLDGSEDNTTAIQTVKNEVEDGAIYNLAGQKVSASYKGVVIKNGKKYVK